VIHAIFTNAHAIVQLSGHRPACVSGMAALDAVYSARIASTLCIVSVNVRNMGGCEKS
jgi:hypothetical protein